MTLKFFYALSASFSGSESESSFFDFGGLVKLKFRSFGGLNLPPRPREPRRPRPRRRPPRPRGFPSCCSPCFSFPNAIEAKDPAISSPLSGGPSPKKVSKIPEAFSLTTVVAYEIESPDCCNDCKSGIIPAAVHSWIIAVKSLVSCSITVFSSSSSSFFFWFILCRGKKILSLIMP